MNERIKMLKECFSKYGEAIMKDDPTLKAVFCTGSIANNYNIPDSSYQDFDIHFYYDKEYLTEKDLQRIRNVFDECVREIENDEVAVDYSVSDKPWKMVPRKKINIGMHGTVLNSFDYQKRVGPNYILAANMFTCSEVLVGSLPLPPHTITDEEFLSNAGGMGWLGENFYRLLPILNPEMEECSEPIREVSIYFGLTPLLHYYYQNNGAPATRKEAKEYFMNDSRVPKSIKDSVNIIYAAKNRDLRTANESLSLLTAAYNTIKYVTDYFAKELPKYKYNTPNTEDDYSSIISNVLDRNIELTASWLLLDSNSFHETYSQIMNYFPIEGAYFPDDFVEAVLFAITHKDIDKIQRIHIFDNDAYRIKDKTDFGPLTSESALYGWEKSISTYVQRLNEYYISGKESKETYNKLAEILLNCAISDYQKIKANNPQLPDLVLDDKYQRDTDMYFTCLKKLTEIGHILNINNELTNSSTLETKNGKKLIRKLD